MKRGPSGTRPARDAGRIAFHNAALFDSLKGVMRRNATVVVEAGRIAHVSLKPLKVADARAYDLKGKALLPGLIDCHVHVTAVDHDVLRLSARPPSLITSEDSERNDIPWPDKSNCYKRKKNGERCPLIDYSRIEFYCWRAQSEATLCLEGSACFKKTL